MLNTISASYKMFFKNIRLILLYVLPLLILSAINIETSKRLIENYISIADGDKINPFSEDGIERLGEITEGNARRFLILCFRLVEFAAKEFKSKDERIDTKFINSHVNQDGILL